MVVEDEEKQSISQRKSAISVLVRQTYILLMNWKVFEMLFVSPYTRLLYQGCVI